MGMLPSLSRIAVAVLGFVAVLLLHESLTTTIVETQVTSSDVENLTTTAAVVQSDPLGVSDSAGIDVNLDLEVSDQDADTVPPAQVLSAGDQRDIASTGDFPGTVENRQEALEPAQSAGVQSDVTPPVSSVVEAVSALPSMRWSAVWRPFFSPTTAQGFADYVSESTGLILRVQPSEVAGHYLVEVQHGTEAERIDADRRIVEFTGFKPPGAVQ